MTQLGRFLAALLVLAALLLVPRIALAQGGVGGVNGLIYDDANDNGMYDFGELGIPGAKVLLVGPSDYVEVQANAQGILERGGLISGTYKVIADLYSYGTLASTNPIGVEDIVIQPGNSTRIELGYHKRCVRFGEPKILWQIGANGAPTGNATVSIPVTNNNAWPISWVYFHQVTPGITVNPNPVFFPTPIPPGGTANVNVTLTGAAPNSVVCFDISFHASDLAICCQERFCFKMPDCDCFQVLESIVDCLPGGGFNVFLALQSLTPLPVNQIWVIGPPGVTVTPTVTNVNLNQGGVYTGNWTVSGVGLEGTTVCLTVMFYSGGVACCVKQVCIKFPFCQTCDDREPVCYAVKPYYDAVNEQGVNYNGSEWSQVAGKTVAAVTCFASFPDDPVLGYMNLEQYQCNMPVDGSNNFFGGWDWGVHGVGPNPANPPNPRGAHNGYNGNPSGPVPADCQWTKKYMGTCFALTFDDQGNLYVAQTSSYNSDYAPRVQDFNAPGTPGRQHVPSPNEIADRRLHGRIFKVANGTGKVTIFNEDTTSTWNGLPSGNDPLITNSYPRPFPAGVDVSDQGFPEVGDITFDYDHNQILATSMDDGKIYRFSMSGTKLGSFDPWAADAGPTHGNGFAGLGEMVWALKYHRGRAYFSRWVEDTTNVSTGFNEVWSVSINGTGNFVPGSLQLELTTPDLPAGSNGSIVNCSAPVSDITFTSEGTPARAKMVLAERGMGNGWTILGYPPAWEHMFQHATGANAPFTSMYPHRARALEYVCEPATQTWALVGSAATNNVLFFQLGNPGGTNACGGVDFDFDNRGCTGPNLGNRLWFTSDYMSSAPWYGIQGIPLTGGNQANSILVDLNGVSGTSDKGTPGDVEVPCPTHGRISGRVGLEAFSASTAGIPVSAVFCHNAVAIGGGVAPMDAEGNVTFECNLSDGTYFLFLRSRSNLVKRVEFTLVNGIATFPNVVLISGDINQDNAVDIADYAILSGAYGSALGDSSYLDLADLNGDGAVDIADYAVLSANFGLEGHPLP